MKPAVPVLLGLGLVALLGHAAAGSGGAQVEQQATPQAILNAVSNVQTTVGNIPPAWSQLLPVAERFVAALGGAAALDKETGLAWELAPASNPSPILGVPWHTAVALCHRTSVGNRNGWRLPTLQELQSLVDPTQDGLALFGARGAVFSWHKGNSEASGALPLRSWCVRGGHGGPEVQ